MTTMKSTVTKKEKKTTRSEHIQRDDTYDHIEDLLSLASYMWVPSDIRKPIDLRKEPCPYLENIISWMDNRHSQEEPYKETKQYAYIKRRLQTLYWRRALAKEILRKTKGFSKI